MLREQRGGRKGDSARTQPPGQPVSQPPTPKPTSKEHHTQVCSKGMTETWVFREWGRGQGSAAS